MEYEPCPKCEKCTWEYHKEEDHTCPYEAEMSSFDAELSSCNCCDDCRGNCAMDI